MPWAGPTEARPVPSLGYRLIRWYQDNLVVPSGRDYGKGLRLTPEQKVFVIRYYQLDDKGHRIHRRGLLRRSKGWGKSPFLGAIAAGELCGPTQFAGWDRNGQPIGKPHPSPLVQVAAVSVDQTDNTYGPIYQMLQDAAEQLNLDVGLTRVFVKGGPGKLEPVTAAAGSREGQPVTFAVLDETHLWTQSNGGRRLAAVLRRNVAKNNGGTIETTNAYVPGDESVAEQSERAAARGQKGLLVDIKEGPPVGDLADREALREALRAAYGDATWVDLDRLVEECNDADTDPSDARRFYLNQIVQSSEQAFDVELFRSRTDVEHHVPDGAVVTLGFDGSQVHDATALVATEVASGFQWPVNIWERPVHAPDDWRQDVNEIDAVVQQCFARWQVWRLYADPPYWEEAIDRWHARWGDRRVQAWWTNRTKQMVFAIQRWQTALRTGELSHSGDGLLLAHVANARRRDTSVRDENYRPMFAIQKDHTNSPRKIDGVMAAILSWEARGDAVAAGVTGRMSRPAQFVSF